MNRQEASNLKGIMNDSKKLLDGLNKVLPTMLDKVKARGTKEQKEKVFREVEKVDFSQLEDLENKISELEKVI